MSNADPSAITIRPAATIADYHACQDVQRRAWGITEEQYVVPIATMVGAQLHGGLVLGAFDAEGQAVGLSFAFLGRMDGRLCLYSQLTGVAPGQQGGGIGLRLKQAQREFARAAGLELIAWAFDPLQAGNAHFNLGRLGARSHTYIENMYGLRTDSLNAGVPTDRLIAVWSTAEEPRSRSTLHPDELEQLPRVVEGVALPGGGLEVIALVEFADGHTSILLEVPDDIGRLRAESPTLAEAWRRSIADTFTTLFAAGFEAVDFVRSPSAAGPRGYYVLHRPPE
jgi:predicted GNAT superfamily acetyltransferase